MLLIVFEQNIYSLKQKSKHKKFPDSANLLRAYFKESKSF